MALSIQSRPLPDQRLSMGPTTIPRSSREHWNPQNPSEPRPGTSDAVETRPNKLNPNVKEILKENPDFKCMFCRSASVNSVEWGPMYNLGKITIHYFCMLFSCGLEQRGRDEDGIMGFLPQDLKIEHQRASRLKCRFCKKNGANIGCGISRCGMSYHYTCGYKKNILFQFYGQYQSYCVNHKKDKAVDIPEDCNKTCIICLESISYSDNDAVWATCCKRNIFHRLCLMKYAVNSAYYFKCPLCNSQKRFKQSAAEQGVYIPDDEATWEQEPDAFREQQVTYSTCDLEPCICPSGRNFKAKRSLGISDWEIIRCSECGSSATHRRCGRINGFRWVCEICSIYFGDGSKTTGDENLINSDAVSQCSSSSSILAAILSNSPEIESEAPILVVGPSDSPMDHQPSPPNWDTTSSSESEYVRKLSLIIKMKEALQAKAMSTKPKPILNSDFRKRLERLKHLLVKEAPSGDGVADSQTLTQTDCQATHNDSYSCIEFLTLAKPCLSVSLPQHFIPPVFDSSPDPSPDPNSEDEANPGLANVTIRVHNNFEDRPGVQFIVNAYKNLLEENLETPALEPNDSNLIPREVDEDQSEDDEEESEDEELRSKVKRKRTVKDRNSSQVRGQKRRHSESSNSDDDEQASKIREEVRSKLNKKLFQEEKSFEAQNPNIFKSSSTKTNFKIPTIKPTANRPLSSTQCESPPKEPNPIDAQFHQYGSTSNAPSMALLAKINFRISQIEYRQKRVKRRQDSIWLNPGQAFRVNPQPYEINRPRECFEEKPDSNVEILDDADDNIEPKKDKEKSKGEDSDIEILDDKVPKKVQSVESEIQILGECVGSKNVAKVDDDEIEVLECNISSPPIGVSRALQNVLKVKKSVPEDKPKADGVENIEIVTLSDDEDDEPCIVGSDPKYWQWQKKA